MTFASLAHHVRNCCLVASLAAALAIGGATRPALAWGTSGHSIVAELAQQRLSPAVRMRVASLIGAGTSLASIASTADTRAALSPQTRRWHYVNIPVTASGYDADRDCKTQPEGDCLVAALGRSLATLADAHASRAVRADALRYVVHLVADAHQPLHCADNDDLGGTQRRVQFFGQSLSLHQVWDFALLDRASFDWGEHVRVIGEWLKTENTTIMSQGRPLDWIHECHGLAGSVAYTLTDDGVLDQAYVDRALPVVHQQLGRAAIRLARAITHALSRPIRD